MYISFIPYLAAALLFTGAVLLADGISNSDTTQSAKLIGGAALLSLGFVTAWSAVKNWWKWRCIEKEHRGEQGMTSRP